MYASHDDGCLPLLWKVSSKRMVRGDTRLVVCVGVRFLSGNLLYDQIRSFGDTEDLITICGIRNDLFGPNVRSHRKSTGYDKESQSNLAISNALHSIMYVFSSR